jgi:catechol 2,3-dioxygenase-like lactoylglutathione lyase family enzyme
MKLDHATVVTSELAVVKDFFCQIAGLREGERPPFSFDGHWLYHDGKAIIHLIKAKADHPPSKQSSRIDHIAFRVEGNTAWQQLMARLQAAQIDFRAGEIPMTGERQLFVVPVPGVMIEFVTAAA